MKDPAALLQLPLPGSPAQSTLAPHICPNEGVAAVQQLPPSPPRLAKKPCWQPPPPALLCPEGFGAAGIKTPYFIFYYFIHSYLPCLIMSYYKEITNK